jgi:hypothetical protein
VDDEDIAVWRIVDLNAVHKRKPYRPSSTKLFDSVNWALVNQTFREALLSVAPGTPEREAVFRAERQLRRKKDRLGLGLLWMEPIVLFPDQVTNGIHRTDAMRRQGVRWTIGSYYESDRAGPWMRAVHEEPF